VMRCAMCNRQLGQAAAMLTSAMPIGPKCAKRAGLLLARPAQTKAVMHGSRRKPTSDQGQNLELFEEVAA